MHVLLVDDDRLFARHVVRHLARREVRVEPFPSAQAGLERALRGGFDAALLDWNMPHRDGCSLCLELRQHGVRAPLLMYTQRDEEHDEIAALACGADDFVTKTVSFDVLVAKLRAHVRRGPWQSPHMRRVGAIVIDEEAGLAQVGGIVLRLTATEFRLLSILAETAGQPMERTELLQRMWGGAPTRSRSGAADVHVAAS